MMKKLTVPAAVILLTSFSFGLKAQTENNTEDKFELVWPEYIYGATYGGSYTDLSEPFDLTTHFSYGLNKNMFSIMNQNNQLFQRLPMIELAESMTVKTVDIVVSGSEEPDGKETLLITSEVLTSLSKDIEITRSTGEKLVFDQKGVFFSPVTNQLQIELSIEEGYYIFTIPTVLGKIKQLSWISWK